jgi:hypothetical protein
MVMGCWADASEVKHTNTPASTVLVASADLAAKIALANRVRIEPPPYRRVRPAEASEFPRRLNDRGFNDRPQRQLPRRCSTETAATSERLTNSQNELTAAGCL